jgi:hypothetical protein
MPDGGEHPGAQRVDRLHLVKVADDRRWLLGQLLEDGPLELGGGGQVKPASQVNTTQPCSLDRWIRIEAFVFAALKTEHLTVKLALPMSSA